MRIWRPAAGGRVIDGMERNAHLRVPDFVLPVDAGPARKAGVPEPSAFGQRMLPVDIQVHPFALGRNLELFVARDALEIAPDEDFRHVPIPELVGLTGGRGMGLQMQLLIGADEEEVDIARRPTGADLGTMAGHGLAAGAVFGEHAGDVTPLAGARVGGEREVGGSIAAHDHRGLACQQQDRRHKARKARTEGYLAHGFIAAAYRMVSR